jgi:hypothetical protein
MVRTSKATVAGYVGIVVLAGSIVSYFVVTAPQRRMQRFLSQLAKVDIGTTTIADWRRQMQAAHLRGVGSACDGGNCTISQQVQVSAVSRLRLAPPSGITASVTFKGGIASEIYVWLQVDNRRTGTSTPSGTGATIHETQESRSCPQHFCNYVTERSGYPWAVVEMDSAASMQDRAKAFALNIGCLTKLRGCRTVKTILPQVFGEP